MLCVPLESANLYIYLSFRRFENCIYKCFYFDQQTFKLNEFLQFYDIYLYMLYKNLDVMQQIKCKNPRIDREIAHLQNLGNLYHTHCWQIYDLLALDKMVI